MPDKSTSTPAGVMTLEEVRAQVEARVQELVQEKEQAGEAPLPGLAVVARDEALERLCVALGYLENSLAEIRASRARIAAERDEMVREVVAVKGDAARLARDLERERERAVCIEEEVERQRARQQRAFYDNKALRDELRSLRLAHREVARQEPLAPPEGALSFEDDQSQSC